MSPLFAAALLAAAASAAPPERPLPESRGIEGSCSVQAFRLGVEVPTFEVPKDKHVPDSWKAGARRAQQEARGRLIAVRRLNHRIQQDLDTIVIQTNECSSVWDSFDVFFSTTESAARDLAEASVRNWLPRGRSPAWIMVRTDGAVDEPPKPGRYAGACRAPDINAELYAPEMPALPADARAKLAGIGTAAAAVSAAMRDQKQALDEMLPLLGGSRCRETLQAFDELIGREHRQFYDYREKAVAGSVWTDLSWKKVSP